MQAKTKAKSIRDIAQIIENNSLDDETKRAIELLIAKVYGEVSELHIKTQEIGDSFLADCRDRKLSRKTIEGYIPHIKKLIELSEEFPPEPKVLQGFMASKGVYNADAHYRTWHAVGNHAKRQYGIPNFMDKVIRPRIPNQIMPTISAEQLNRLAVLLRDAPLRDKAILALLIDTAIRHGEAISLKRDDILEDRIIVQGKTGWRVAPLSPITRELLLALPVYEDGYVFHGTNKKKPKPLGHTGLWKIVRKYLRAAGYKGKQASPQMLRRSFGVFHLNDGGDLKSLSLILGHSNITTTARCYTPLLEQDVIKLHHKHTPARVFWQIDEEKEGI